MLDISDLEARFFMALGHPNRIKIVEVILKKGSRCNCELVTDTGFKQSNLSRHIKELINAGVLRFRREGNKVRYEIADKRIQKVIELVESIVKSNVFKIV
ncbi:MAG: ArsR/SmtB family transcription factor [Brevinematia bacterium]